MNLAQLRNEKRKLLKIAKKERKAQIDMIRAKEERDKLRKEIRDLKDEVGKGVIAKVKKLNRYAKSPETKKKVGRIKDNLKYGYKQFQKFANKYGY